MNSSANLSDALSMALLSGTFDEMAPVFRIGDTRYVRFDQIDISNQLLTFWFRGKVVSTQVIGFKTDHTLSISRLEGRLKVSVE